MSWILHKGDLPADFKPGPAVAIDTEAMGLNPLRDRLCLVQISNGDGTAHLIQLTEADRGKAPRLAAILADPAVEKIFHFARFDVAGLYHFLGVMPNPIFCTKIASKLVRTFTDRHSLKELCKVLLGVEIPKEEGCSDWGAAELREAQLNYAAQDVLYLHALRDKLELLLAREGRTDLAKSCFNFLPTRAKLDLAGWPNTDIFNYA